jgi:hypothetical protein
MANFAVLFGGVVSNIIVADTKETAEYITGTTCIEYDETNPAGVGHSYDERYKVFVPEGKTYNPITESFEDIKADK